MYSYPKKFLFLSFFILILFSCTLEKADKEYKKGNYLKSAELAFEYFDKKSGEISKINPKIRDELSSRFSNIISHYKNLSESSINTIEKLNADISLFALYSMIESRSYTKSFPELNRFISDNDAEYFYNESESIINHLSRKYMNEGSISSALNQIDYLNTLIRYSEKAYNSPINSEKYRRYAKRSAKNKADIYISAAEINESKGNYRNAQNLFKSAFESYSAYDGNYRSSYDRYYENKKNADLQDAESYYNSGLNLMRTAGNLRYRYRKAYEEFRTSQKYVPSYKNSDSLMKEAHEKGFIKYFLLTYNTSYSQIIDNAMAGISNKNFSGAPDLIIEYDEDVYYDILNSHTNSEIIEEKTERKVSSFGDISQKIQTFRKTVSSKTEVIRIKFSITARGNFYSNRITDYVTFENPVTETIYTGDVPEKYFNSYSGKLLGKEEIRRHVDSELRNKIKKVIDTMANELAKH